MNTITAKAVLDTARMKFLPDKLPGMYLRFEHGVFSLMGNIAKGYLGGYWDFFELSNGGFYMAVAGNERFEIAIASNGYEGNVSADAAGIIVSMYILNQMSWEHPENTQLSTYYYALRDYGAQHPEKHAIFGATD